MKNKPTTTSAKAKPTGNKGKTKPEQAQVIDVIPQSIRPHHRDAYLSLLADLRKLPEFNNGKLVILEILFMHRSVLEEAASTLASEGVTMPGPNCLLAHPAVAIANAAADRVGGSMQALGLIQRPRRQAEPKHGEDPNGEANPWV